MQPRIKYCFTCDSDELHRPLTDKEKDWLREKSDTKYLLNEFFMCAAPGCRNLRTGLNKHPFDPVIRLPLD